jgi:hypothetical protein
MQVCVAAGIDIQAKAIWAGRAEILAGLAAGELRTWLAARIAATEPQPSPPR